MNLSFDKTDPYLFYQQCDFEMAYHAVDIIIKHELKHKNYASLLISLLNHNMILHVLKIVFFTGEIISAIQNLMILMRGLTTFQKT